MFYAQDGLGTVSSFVLRHVAPWLMQELNSFVEHRPLSPHRCLHNMVPLECDTLIFADTIFADAEMPLSTRKKDIHAVAHSPLKIPNFDTTPLVGNDG